MLKIGLDSFSLHRTLANMPPREAAALFLDRVLQLGLDGWQFDPMHLDGWDRSLVEEIGAMSQSNGLYLELGSGGFDFDYLIGRLELAAEVDARCLRTFVSWERAEVGEERVREIAGLAVPHLSRLGERAEGLGVPIAVENHEDLTSAELQEMLDAVGSSQVRACVDTGNALSVGEDPAECVHRLAPYAAACHLKDWSVRVRGGRLERTSRPFGCGDAKLAEVFGVLRAVRPDMPITIEQPFLNPRTAGTAAEEEEGVRQAVEFLRALDCGAV